MEGQLSKVQMFMQENPASGEYVSAALQGEAVDSRVLVDDHLVPMIASVFRRIRAEVRPDSLTAEQALLFIQELSVFARYNSQFLHRAATSVEHVCFELAHELRRNHLEEGGERGKIPAHYTLYSRALMLDLGVMVNGRVPFPETHVLLTLHDLLVTSHSASTICGGYFATEGVAIDETELLKEITDRFADLTSGRSGAGLPNLDYYYSLHLDDSHEAAAGQGLSVEASHMDGIARFVREADLFNLDTAQTCDGFLQIMEGMAYWWTELAARSSGIVRS